MPFDTVAETLLKGGIAPRHVRRYIGELCDHLEDGIAQQKAGPDIRVPLFVHPVLLRSASTTMSPATATTISTSATATTATLRRARPRLRTWLCTGL